MMPSTPSNPVDSSATPIDCRATVNPGLQDQIYQASIRFSWKDDGDKAYPRLTWSVNSCPKKEPPKKIVWSVYAI